MKKTGLSLLLTILLALLGACALATEKEPAGPPAPAPQTNDAGMPLMPDFTLPSSLGTDVKLSDFRGKKVVINFWATWCGYCVEEMPEFQAFYDEYVQAEESPYALMSVNLTDGLQETREMAQAYMEKNGFTFPVYYDESNSVFGMLGQSGIPVTIVIDEQGFLADGVIGATTLDTLKDMLGIPQAQE